MTQYDLFRLLLLTPSPHKCEIHYKHLRWHGFKNNLHLELVVFVESFSKLPNPQPPACWTDTATCVWISKRELCPYMPITFTLNDQLCSSSGWCCSSVWVFHMVELWPENLSSSNPERVTLQCALHPLPLWNRASAFFKHVKVICSASGHWVRGSGLESGAV